MKMPEIEARRFAEKEDFVKGAKVVDTTTGNHLTLQGKPKEGIWKGKRFDGKTEDVDSNDPYKYLIVYKRINFGHIWEIARCPYDIDKWAIVLKGHPQIICFAHGLDSEFEAKVIMSTLGTLRVEAEVYGLRMMFTKDKLTESVKKEFGEIPEKYMKILTDSV